MKMQKILVVDDEKGIRESLTLILGMEGFDVDAVEDAQAALARIDSGVIYDFIICDIKLPGMSGIEFLEETRKRDLPSVMIMISAYGTIETSIEAIKKGAADYINKPINSDELLLRMSMAREREKLRVRNAYLTKELDEGNEFQDIVYSSGVMEEVVSLSRKAAEVMTTVLVRGESGTGKELVARAIHNSGGKKDSSFVAVNCAAIPEGLMESELFGYAKGAFSGAHSNKRGLIEEAHGGTLFLDEIGEIPVLLQSKLLRFLQEHEIRRLGEVKNIRVDTRVIAATSRDLERDVSEGRFRDDLYFRLNVFPIHIPPLRERKEDIPELVRYFLNKFAGRINPAVKSVSARVMSEVVEYDWPGNVRELQNVIERAIILSDTDTITRIDISDTGSAHAPDIESWLQHMSFEEAKQKIEKIYIRQALTKTGGNRTRAAKILGISRRALLYKLKEMEDS